MKELTKWTAPYAGTPLEPLVLLSLSKNPVGLGNPQETFPRTLGEGLLRDYTGRDCDVQDIVQPANPSRAVRESLMLDAKQRAAGSSPAGGISSSFANRYGGYSSVG